MICRVVRQAEAWALSALAVALMSGPALAGAPPAAVDFTRDVRPILAKNCLTCHGADPGKREADLRIDQFETVGDVHGAGEVITLGNPNESELIRRITSDDPDEHMPPADSGKELKPEEIETLRRWV